MFLREFLNEPVRWKYVYAAVLLYAGTAQEHWGVDLC